MPLQHFPISLAVFLAMGVWQTGPALAQTGQNLVTNSTFDSGKIAPWVVKATGPGARVDASVEFLASGAALNTTLVLDVADPNLGVFGVEVGQNVPIVQGRTYKVSFWALAVPPDDPVEAVVKIGATAPPYTSYFERRISIPGQVSATQWGRTFEWTFTATASDPNAWFGLFVGGTYAAIKLDSLYLLEAGEAAPATPVLANQVGYLPSGAKRATAVSTSATALPWRLVNAQGTAVANGQTTPRGQDPAAGKAVHVVDFSSFTGTGQGLRLEVGTTRSAPFDVRADVFQNLRRDALRFYYHQRASSAIVAPFAGGAAWVRAAGHPDDRVPCLPGSGCSYTLDVSRGWYDAGDHGKYVVNGGIAVWTLMNLYERTRHLGTTLAQLGDGTLNIPEGGNGQPDLLDEVRWQMTFMLGMQVPEGQPLAGLAHHKVHADRWTPIPTVPAQDDRPRYLHPPSTAATLNLAATAAQCARVFAGVDDAFAARCRTAAERAFRAAQQHPARYASTDATMGGGPYDDRDVSDEIYWAVAELFLTTGEPTYREALKASPHFARLGAGVPFSWQSVAGLGTVSLAIVPGALAAADVGAVRRAVVTAADAALGRIMASGFGAPVTAYGWGSNGDVLNAGVLLAVAHDLVGQPAYFAGAVSAMDHVLGRNALDHSYVSGYGTRAFQNAHHRFWAKAVDPGLPPPPPGVIAGGPNAQLDGLAADDPLKGCAPMTCWRDDAGAYSFTEVTINWNAPLAWLAAWLHEMGTSPPTSHPGLEPVGMGVVDAGADGAPGDGAMGADGAPGDGATDVADAGPGGPGTNDAGAPLPTTDAGTLDAAVQAPGTDAGGVADGGVSDASNGVSPNSTAGCGCELGGPGGTPPAPGLLAGVAVLLVLGRRRRR